MDVIDLDIETYSPVELKKANVYAYVEDPDFEILMCGWGLNDGPITVEDDSIAVRALIKEWVTDPGVKLVAHNAGFERVCFSTAMGMPVGEYLPPEQWFDTAAVAALRGLPRTLEALAKALGLTPKDGAGTRLINLFSKPYRGRRIFAHERPEQWEEFRVYCAQDVGTMREARHKMGGWPIDGFERDLWYVDQRINDRGMAVDLALAGKAVEAAQNNTAEAEREVIRLTGVDNPGSTQQLGRWCEEQGFPMPNWQAETVKDALSRSDVPEGVEQVLRLRQELALVAHRKFEAALRGASSDGRLRGQFVYGGAHTLRWSSKGVQVHNLARLAFEYKDEEGEKHYDDVAEDIAITAILRGLGAPPEILKRCVRPMFILDGVSSDFSAIEARVLAWLAGEDWVIQAFEDGRDLYVEQAGRMGGGMERPDGKIAILAGGYQGSVGSFRNMGYGGRRCGRDLIPMPRNATDLVRDDVLLRREDSHAAELARDPNHKCDAEILKVVRAYRDANDNIRQFWYDLERKFWTGGVVGAGKIRIEVKGSARWIHLPSGRILRYHGVHRQTVKTIDPLTGEVTGTKQQLAYRHIQGYIEKTYGGRLTENVTQAVARDLLADALLRLDRAGYRIVGHVHDEALVESKDVEGIREIMRTGPAWAEGLPLDASANILYRYRKD